MFQFPGFASLRREMTALADSRVAPFGHLGITACVPLPELLAAYHGLHRLRVPRHPPHAFLRLTTYGTSKVRASLSQSTYTNPTSGPRLAPRPVHRLGKDSISHESVIDQKTKVDDPSSVVHFSISVRDPCSLAVSLAL